MTIDLERVRKALAELDRLADQHPRLLGVSTPEEWEETLKGALMKDEIFTVSEVAELLKCHDTTIRREIKRGKLKAAKFGKDWRISRVELQRYWVSLGGGQLFSEEATDEGVEQANNN